MFTASAAFTEWASLAGNHVDLLGVYVARGAVGADYTVAPRSLYSVLAVEVVP